MKTLKNWMMGLTMGFITSVSAQVMVVNPSKDSYQPAMAPVVLLDVLTKGAQAVGHYLMYNVDHVNTYVDGASVPAGPWQNSRYFSFGDLVSLGYTHRGSFDELSAAMAGVPFNMSVIPTPQGWYDVRMTLSYYDANNKVTLNGSGWLDISKLPDGFLQVGEFNPYVTINSFVAVKMTNTCFSGVAKWIPKNGAQPVDLVTYWEDNFPLIIVPGEAFENGYLAVADCFGNVKAWDLETGEVIMGDRVHTIMGQSHSGDFYVVRDTIDTKGAFAYRDGGQIYGHVPLTEVITTTKPINDGFDLGIPVWGSTDKVYPTEVWFTPIYVADPRSGLGINKEYPVQQNNKDGKWMFGLPQGSIFHVRTKYPNITNDRYGGPGRG